MISSCGCASVSTSFISIVTQISIPRASRTTRSPRRSPSSSDAMPMTRSQRAGLLLGLLILGISSVSSAQEYTIGPKDVLKIVVWGQDDLSKEYPVGADGFVPFPLIGRAKAAGL